MVIKFNFRFVLFIVICFCIYGFSNAKTNLRQTTSETDTVDKSRPSKSKGAETTSKALSGKKLKIEMPAIIVKEDPSQKSSFLLPSPKKEEKPFSPIKRRKAIRHKANEIYSKEAPGDKTNVENDLSSFLPDRARASITRSMHQIVVEKEKGLKPKIEYKSVKYVMMPEEVGNEIQTTSNKKDTHMKDLDFPPSISKFLIKRKYLIGSLNGKTSEKKDFQVIVDGHTVMNDKYLTSTADPIGYKQKSDQKSVNALEEVKLMKTMSSKKMYYKEPDIAKQKKGKKSKTKSLTKKSKQNKSEKKQLPKDIDVKSSPITKYDKMTMREKLVYTQQFNENNPTKTVKTEFGSSKPLVKSEKVKAKSQKSEVFVTRRKSIRPKQNDSKYSSQNVPLNIEVDTKDWKSNYRRKKNDLMQSMLEPEPVLRKTKNNENAKSFKKKHKEYTVSIKRKSKEHIVSMGKKSKEQNIPAKLDQKDTAMFGKETLYGSNPINIKIDTKDWKTNYSKKKNKLLQAMLDSSTYEKGRFKEKKNKAKAKSVKEVVQQKNVHSYLIKPNTVIEVGNTEITVGIPSHVAKQTRTTDRKSKGNTLKKIQTEIKAPATLKAFRSDEVRVKIDTVTVQNAEKSNGKISAMQTTTTAPSPPKEALRSAKQPSTTTHFPLKIEFVTAKIPAELEGNRNKSSLTKRKNHKKFITNGLSEDSQKSRIITSSENLNVNLDHYADFTRTGITNGENNIVVGTLSGIKDRANAGMINLQVDTAEREQALNITKITGSRPTDRHTVATNKKLFNVKTKPYNIHKTISTNSQSQTSLSNVKKQDKSMTDFSISLLAAHEVEKATQAPLKKTKPTVKAPVKKSPRFVLRNNNNSGKSFVFSFKTNKKPKKNVPKVTSVQFQPAFIYKDTAEIHRSENSLFANSIHEKSEKTPNNFYKHSIMRENHKDFRWPVPSKIVQGIPVTQPPPEVSTLGLIISGDFVSSFAEQAFKDVSSDNKVSRQSINRTTAKTKFQPKQTVKSDFLFPIQSFYTPSPKAITTVDLALVTRKRNGLYQNDKYYSSDIHYQIQELLNSTETNQLTDIPGNIDIQTSTVPLPKMRNTFIQSRPKTMPFVYTAESQAGRTKMQRINNKQNVQNLVERTTLGNSAPPSITGFDLGLSMKRNKSKKTYIQMTQATQAFEETSQSPMKNIVKGSSSLSNFRRMQIPSRPIETVIYPTVSVQTERKGVTEKPRMLKKLTSTTTTTTTTTTPKPKTTSTTSTTSTTTATTTTTEATTTRRPTVASTTTTEKPSTTTTPGSIKEVISDLSSLNDIAKKAKDALQRISEVFKGPPDNIIAVSKTDAYKKYKKAATEVIEMKKSPTMVPAVGIIKPLRKSEAIYKFSQYGSKRSQEMTEDNAIKREIKKLLIQQNTIYPGPLQKGPVSYPRVTPMMDQNVYTQNEITSNARGMLYNTPEMTSMMIATESMAPEQNGGYIQNYNFPGANRQALGNSARLPFQNSVRVTPPMPIVQPIVQPKVYCSFISLLFLIFEPPCKSHVMKIKTYQITARMIKLSLLFKIVQRASLFRKSTYL